MIRNGKAKWQKGWFCPMQKKKNRQSHHGAHHCGARRHGGFWAFSQRDAAPAALGTEYHIQELNDNVLTEPGQELTCTITIRCDTVLQSLDSLREEKLPMSRATA